SFRPEGKTRNDLPRGDRGQPRDLFFRRDHNRRLHPAVHAERRRRPHIQPNGEDLRLRACRALLATFTVVPAFSAYLLHERVRETETMVVNVLRRIYTPMVEFAVAHRILALAAAGLLLALALFAARFLGLEFLPHLEEGNLWIRAPMPPS